MIAPPPIDNFPVDLLLYSYVSESIMQQIIVEKIFNLWNEDF